MRKHLLQKCNDIGLPPNQTIQISGHKNIGSVNNYSSMNSKQQKEIAMAITNNSIPSTSTTVMQNKSPNNIQFSQASSSKTSSKCEIESMFQGTTIIHGGIFNFYSKAESPSPKRKFRRVMPLSIDSDSD